MDETRFASAPRSFGVSSSGIPTEFTSALPLLRSARAVGAALPGARGRCKARRVLAASAAAVLLAVAVCLVPKGALALESASDDAPASMAFAASSAPAAPAHAASAACPATPLPAIVLGQAQLVASADLPAADARFAGYVQREFSSASSAAATGRLQVQKTLRGDRLEGQEAVVYARLADRIRQVAAGRESSTQVAIPLADLGVKDGYTASDLGLESIYADPANPVAVSEEARAAVNAQFQVALLRVLNAVLSDFPYDLYWYDKTVGIAFQAPDISAVDNGEGGAIVFAKPHQATFKMCVAADYSPGNVAGGFVADTALTGAASAAVDVAQAIVDEHAAESDYDKLHAYLQAVAKRTDYDYDAVVSYETTGLYGDPWQVIHVFDDDSTTKVVCEGYAKAFQYLCDLSEFSDATIACNSVSGDMVGGTGAGPHMWNVVAIGQKNYLVDVTNNDNFPDNPETAPPSTTPNDELFLAGAEGSVYDGYRVAWPDAASDAEHWISYYYEENMLHYFDEAELTLSATSYAQDVAGGGAGGDEPDPGPGGDEPDPEPTDAERAQQVAQLIDAIGKVAYDERSAVAIAAARAAYDALSPEQRALVDNAFALLNAEARYRSLESAANQGGSSGSGESGDSGNTGDSGGSTASDGSGANEPGGAGTGSGGNTHAGDGSRSGASSKPATTAIALNTAKVTKAAVVKALKRAGAKAADIKTITLGKKVKAIGRASFAQLKKAKTLVLKTKKLKKATTKGCLAKSAVKTVKVKVGAAKQNAAYAKKYKKLFAGCRISS